MTNENHNGSDMRGRAATLVKSTEPPEHLFIARIEAALDELTRRPEERGQT